MNSRIMTLFIIIIVLLMGSTYSVTLDYDSSESLVTCDVAPCSTTTCNRYSTAKCKNNWFYCAAEFYVNGILVDCDTEPACLFPKVANWCKGNFQRFFFNKLTGKCEEFTYGGCDPAHNPNNFVSRARCNDVCIAQPAATDCYILGARKQVLAKPGLHIPSCEVDGSFKLKQCDGITGTCWCAHTKSGEEIEGTRTAGDVECSDHMPRECPEDVPIAGCSKMPCDGVICEDFPEASCQNNFCGGCNADFYIKGQKVECESNQPAAAQPQGAPEVTKCIQQRGWALVMSSPGFVLECAPDGSFKLKQCDWSTGNCWCVNTKSGREIKGSNIGGDVGCSVFSNELKHGNDCERSCLKTYFPVCGSDGTFSFKYPNNCRFKEEKCKLGGMLKMVNMNECNARNKEMFTDSEPSSPWNLFITEITHNSAILHWTRPENPNGQITRYEILYGTLSPYDVKKVYKGAFNMPANMTYLAASLTAEKDYFFKITAFNKLISKTSASKGFTTLKRVLKFQTKAWTDPVKNFKIVHQGSRITIDCSTDDKKDIVNLVFPSDKAGKFAKKNLETLPNQQFRLLVASVKQAGLYKCESNRGGKAIEFALGTLIIRRRIDVIMPVIHPSYPRPLTFGLHQNTKDMLSCSTSDNIEGPAIDLRWYKVVDGKKQAVNASRAHVKSDPSLNGKILTDKTYLSFLDFTEEDEGQYICQRMSPVDGPTSQTITIKLGVLDPVCSQVKDMGVCTTLKHPFGPLHAPRYGKVPAYCYKTRYFYNQATRNCESFIYRGRNGNSNNFATEEACEKTCHVDNCAAKACGYNYEPVCGSDGITYSNDCRFELENCRKKKTLTIVKKGECRNMKADNPRCSLPKAIGKCRMSLKRYYYDKQANQCKLFSYGGCHGNRNRFAMLKYCIKSCVTAY